MEEIQNTLNCLREYVSKAHRAIEALEDLEKTGIIPPGTIVNPRRPDPISPKMQHPERTGKPIPSTGEKQCKKCLQIKPLDSFPLHKECADGHLGTCKECRNTWNKERKKQQTGNSKDKRSRKSPAAAKSKPAAEEPWKYKCKKCGQKFKTYLGLTTHIDVQHPRK
ncbi:MAG: hypothetical protein JXR49_02625 [Acidobacteria bacterium]|nr:hypothetical protein [Acidobacteriota bacterium]